MNRLLHCTMSTLSGTLPLNSSLIPFGVPKCLNSTPGSNQSSVVFRHGLIVSLFSFVGFRTTNGALKTRWTKWSAEDSLDDVLVTPKLVINNSIIPWGEVSKQDPLPNFQFLIESQQEYPETAFCCSREFELY